MAEINKINVNGTEYDIKPFEGNDYNMDPTYWQPKKVGKILTPTGAQKDLYRQYMMGKGEIKTSNKSVVEIPTTGGWTGYHSFNYDNIIYKIEGTFFVDLINHDLTQKYATSITGIEYLSGNSLNTINKLYVSLDNMPSAAPTIEGIFYLTIYYYS